MSGIFAVSFVLKAFQADPLWTSYRSLAWKGYARPALCAHGWSSRLQLPACVDDLANLCMQVSNRCKADHGGAPAGTVMYTFNK